MDWEGVAPGSACPCIENCFGFSYLYKCSSIPDYTHGSVGELFIVVNFTSFLQAEKDARVNNGPPWGARAFEIKLSLESEYARTLYGFYYTNIPWGDSFLLLPNVRLWATLAMTTEQSLANKNSVALGISKVGCDAHSPTLLIMFLVSNFAYIQYR